MTAGEICPTAELHQERSGAEPTKGARAGHDSNHFRHTENNKGRLTLCATDLPSNRQFNRRGRTK